MSLDTDVSAAARSYIEGLDRSVLGDFAVHWYPLYLAHKSEVYWMLTNELEARLQLSSSVVLDAQQDEVAQLGRIAARSLIDHFSVDEQAAAKNEVLYWWSTSGNPVMEKQARADSMFDRSLRIASIASSPRVMHPYFKVGIWNTDVIARCINEGIDADLAASLNYSASAVTV